MRTALLILAATCLQAQAPPAAPPLARIEGRVVADANGTPLRRVQIVLQPLDAGRPALGTQTDDRGAFVLRDIGPGPYQLSAQRDGYLTTSTFRRQGLRMPERFTISRGDAISGVEFRLRPWSVISGKIRFEDGDPAVALRVDLFRQYHLRGRRGFARVASGATDDRGEYRIHGLAPGPYYVAVDFQGDRTGPNVEDQPGIDPFGREVSLPSYTTTFYPGTLNLRDANPVRLREGEDMAGIDIYLRSVERVKLAGRITNGISGEILTSATLVLERLDAGNTGTLPAPASPRFDRDGRFHLDNVAPGSYQLWVDASAENTRLLGRQALLVTNDNIEDLEIVVVPARDWSGEVIAARGSESLPRGFEPRVVLEPRSERGAIVTPSPKNRKFDASLAPAETYDVFITNLPANLYISEVRVLGGDVRANGLSGSMVSGEPFQIVLDSRGGRIAGRISAATSASGFDDPAWSGAALVLIPEGRDRLQHYRETQADQYGRFELTGIAPGRYTLTGYLDQPPCDVYDEADLDRCRATGMTVDVTPGSLQELQLRIKSDAKP
ncbi:MAG: hypothetical protein RL328_458 [Acidobacteriota bacterium]